MKSFDRALEDCLEQINGGKSLETCLHRYPQYAGRLLPLLRTALELQQSTPIHPTEEFKRRARVDLANYMTAHPHKSPLRRNEDPSLTNRGRISPLLKPANIFIGLFALLVLAFFTTGTALAQSALPGQSLYPWKLTSEKVWRAVSPDHVATNLALAQRRTQEAKAVTGADRAVALKGYENVLSQLVNQSQASPEVDQRIAPVLKNQQDELEKSGIKVPKLDDYLAHPRHKSEHPSPSHTPKPTRTEDETGTPPPTSAPTPISTPMPVLGPAPILTPMPVLKPVPGSNPTPAMHPLVPFDTLSPGDMSETPSP